MKGAGLVELDRAGGRRPAELAATVARLSVELDRLAETRRRLVGLAADRAADRARRLTAAAGGGLLWPMPGIRSRRDISLL